MHCIQAFDVPIASAGISSNKAEIGKFHLNLGPLLKKRNMCFNQLSVAAKINQLFKSVNSGKDFDAEIE